jgi:hypothetical protein
VTPPDVEFRVVETGALSDADVVRMVELLGLAFGGWPATAPGVDPADHLRWKISSPATVCAAVLGESGGTLITTDTPMGYRIRLREREGLRMQFVDHAVRPGWRGRKVSSASIAFRQSAVAPRYDLSIADGQSPTMIHRAVKFGTRRFGNEIHPLVLPLRGREFAERWARTQGLPAWLGRPFGALLDSRADAHARRRADGRAPEPGIVPVDRFDRRIDTFFAAAGAPWDLIVVRSHAHLDWRYCDARSGRFHKLVAQDAAGGVLGYAVTCVREERGSIVDLLALPDRPEVIDRLVGALVADLVSARCVEALCWLPQRHPYRAALHRAGFFDARELPVITFRPARVDPHALDFLTEPDLKIHFTLGDTDLV